MLAFLEPHDVDQRRVRPFFLMAGAIADMTGRKASGADRQHPVDERALRRNRSGRLFRHQGALQVLTKNAANAHLADQIRVNGINLGWVDTETERHLHEVTLGKGEGWLAAQGAKLPLGRFVSAEECARLAVWLLADASAPMTGVSMDLEQSVTGCAVTGHGARTAARSRRATTSSTGISASGPGAACPASPRQQHLGGTAARRGRSCRNRRQRRHETARHLDVVEADDGDVARHAHPPRLQPRDQAEGDHVGGTEHRRGPILPSPGCAPPASCPGFQREIRPG